MFKFTIRDLFWLTLLAAVLVAWWVDRSSLNRTLAFLSSPYRESGIWTRDVALPLRNRSAPVLNPAKD